MWLRRRRTVVYQIATPTKARNRAAPMMPPAMGPTFDFVFEAAVRGASGEVLEVEVEVEVEDEADGGGGPASPLDEELATEVEDDFGELEELTVAEGVPDMEMEMAMDVAAARSKEVACTR
jgi:hypothetical protein